MAQSTDSRMFMASDVQYLITFGLGMAAFWLSGWVGGLVARALNQNLPFELGMAVTAAVYGGIFIIWSLIVLRKFALKALLVGVILAVALAIGSAQVILDLASDNVRNLFQLGLLTFVLYLCYGLIYALSLTVAKRLAR
jgi:hypothetical protein